MRVATFDLRGQELDQIELPPIFETPFRRDVIHKVYTNMNSHRFQPQGRHPTAGMDVSADSNDPPTGRGQSRVARALGGGGGRQGQGAEVASTRGGRQAHPPIVDKVIHKKINKKERILALCSAIAATKSSDIVASRGHKLDQVKALPLIVSDDIERVSKTKELIQIITSLGLLPDLQRLDSRKRRSGQSRLRGRTKKVGKSVLFVVHDSKEIAKAVGTIPGVEAKKARELSVLDLAPGSDPIRLVVYSMSAIKDIAEIRSTHLEVMAMVQ